MKKWAIEMKKLNSVKAIEKYEYAFILDSYGASDVLGCYFVIGRDFKRVDITSKTKSAVVKVACIVCERLYHEEATIYHIDKKYYMIDKEFNRVMT
jgi:hypothetical protein